MEYHPLTRDTWKDFETLFGKNGACGGCWCMLWRLPRKRFEEMKGSGNRDAMRKTVYSEEVPGIIAYKEGEPIGWCALAPRDVYQALNRSRILQPVDDQPCWSISCFFIRRDHRRKGVSSGLIRAAGDYARRNGARILEAYPVEPRHEQSIPAAFAWTGLAGAFASEGFVEVARRSPTRPIMRRDLGVP